MRFINCTLSKCYHMDSICTYSRGVSVNSPDGIPSWRFLLRRPTPTRAMLGLLLAPLGLAVTGPSPSLTPLAVVNAQLEALSAGDVATSFEFASPSNKEATGPWQRFEMMVRCARGRPRRGVWILSCDTVCCLRTSQADTGVQSSGELLEL